MKYRLLGYRMSLSERGYLYIGISRHNGEDGHALRFNEWSQKGSSRKAYRMLFTF